MTGQPHAGSRRFSVARVPTLDYIKHRGSDYTDRRVAPQPGESFGVENKPVETARREQQAALEK